jgi:hypothetical protein
LSRVGFATVDALLAHAGSLGLTPEVLDRWCESKLLHRAKVMADPISGAEAVYVALAPAGARLLANLAGHAVHAVSAARLRRSSQKRRHDLAVGDLALAVMTLARDGRIDLLGVETDDRKLATTITMSDPGRAARRVALQADALVLARGEKGSAALLVEVDRGTISIAKMAEKYAAYLAWHRQRGPERDFSVKALRVATIAPDERRLGKLHDAALKANGGKRSGFLLFALQGDVSPMHAERLLAPIARTLGPKDSPRVPLLPTKSTDGASQSPGSRAIEEDSPRARPKSPNLAVAAPHCRPPAAADPPRLPVL